MAKHKIQTFVDGTSKKQLTQGVTEIFKANSKIENHLEELERNGYTILKNVFSKNDCSIAKKKIDEIYKKQIKEFNNEKNLELINEKNIVRSLFVYDSFFLKFLDKKIQNQLLTKIFGKKFILNLQNSPIMQPKSRQYSAAWHRDLSYQHFVSSRQVAISTVVSLDKSTQDNGATFLLPHSHKFEMFPSKEYVKKHQKQIPINAGDTLVFDSLMYHRSGANKTNQKRKIIVHMFTLPFIKQQINYVKFLNGKYLNNKKYSYLLGYNSEVQDSVMQWRERRKNRFKKSSVKLWRY